MGQDINEMMQEAPVLTLDPFGDTKEEVVEEMCIRDRVCHGGNRMQPFCFYDIFKSEYTSEHETKKGRKNTCE